MQYGCRDAAYLWILKLNRILLLLEKENKKNIKKIMYYEDNIKYYKK